LTSQPADDLTLINGIGPKIASVLQAAGVTTFAQLASMDADQVWQILRAANIRLGAPEKWIEQAKHLP
jgi:predicted flap endonuclease-1-like 5' DNA nuclease